MSNKRTARKSGLGHGHGPRLSPGEAMTDALLDAMEAEYRELVETGDFASIDNWVRAVILRLLQITGSGPNQLMIAMWATGLHRAIIGGRRRPTDSPAPVPRTPAFAGGNDQEVPS